MIVSYVLHHDVDSSSEQVKFKYNTKIVMLNLGLGKKLLT